MVENKHHQIKPQLLSSHVVELRKIKDGVEKRIRFRKQMKRIKGFVDGREIRRGGRVTDRSPDYEV